MAIDNIETLAQRTLASNKDDRVLSYTTEGTIVTVTIPDINEPIHDWLTDIFDCSKSYDIYAMEINYVGCIDRDVSIDEANCYQDGKIVFSVDCGGMEINSTENKTFYGFVPVGNNKYDKYKVNVTMYKSSGIY